MKDEAYLAWRESESYQVPMTAEGEEEAQKRWRNFRKGWNAAVKACAADADWCTQNYLEHLIPERILARSSND